MAESPRGWPVVTAKCETSLYRGWSAWPVTFGVEGDGCHYGGDGREIGYLSGGKRDPDSPAWRERRPGEEPMTCLWLRLNPDELANLPGVAEAVDRMRAGVASGEDHVALKQEDEDRHG